MTESQKTTSLGELRDMLDDVRDMASFFQRVFWFLQDPSTPLSVEEMQGCVLCVEALKDKVKQIDSALQPGDDHE